MKSEIIGAIILIDVISALSVVQWQDSMVIQQNHYLDLYNANEANLLNDKKHALSQKFSVDMNNNFLNTEFDIIIFDHEDESGFDCY